MHRFGRFTGVQVQNVSAGPINVTVSYVGTAGACAGNSYSDTATGVLAGTSKTFVQLAGQIQSPGELHGRGDDYCHRQLRGHRERAKPDRLHRCAVITYSAIARQRKTTKVSAPLFKDRRFGRQHRSPDPERWRSQCYECRRDLRVQGRSDIHRDFDAAVDPIGWRQVVLAPPTMPAGTFTAWLIRSPALT